MNTQYYVKTIPREGWDDVYLTTVARSPLTDEASVERLFQSLAKTASDGGISFLQEKIYGVCAEMETILHIRARVYDERGLQAPPPTFIEGVPCVGGLVAGVQIIGVVPRSDEVRVHTLTHDDAVVGRELRTPSHRMLFFTAVSGFEAGSELSVTEQAARMFERTRTLLAAHDLSPKHIVRTWIYMARILDWYGEFNRVRTRYFREFGIIDGDSFGVLPASTGIQGKRLEGEECFMDVLAVAADEASANATPMNNARQNEAYDYGSSFSRGMAVGPDDQPTLYISGTASIDTRGHTIHHGDEQGQVMETLLDIASLLDSKDARLRDIMHATAYCKGESDYRAFERIRDHLDMKDIPFVPVLADVCRDELLFEVDSVAVPRPAS